MMKIRLSSSMLDARMGQTKLFTVKFDEDFLAEFHAASEILGARTTSAFVHQFAMQKVREAKKIVDADEFAEIKAKKISELKSRSKERTDFSKKKSDGVEIAPKSKKKMNLKTENDEQLKKTA